MAKKKSLAQRVGSDRGLLKRALRDPGLRSKLPTKYLTPAQRSQRAVTQRFAQPITPGSSITEGELARESKAATAVKYGPQERALQQQVGVAQQTQRDVGGFYDQYLARLAQNQRDISNIQQGVQVGLQGVAQGVTGLSASGLQSLQSQADQSATARGTTAGDLSTLASNAAAIRQSLIGSFQAQQQLVGGTENAYASQLANVVGPGQKLQAVAQQGQKVSKARQDILDLATEKGQADYLYRQQARQAEAKNVLAAKIAEVGTAGKAATTAKTKVETAKTKAETDFFKKHGYYPPTGPPKGKSAGEKKTEAELKFFNKHGYWPPTGPGKGGKGGEGGGWQTPKQQQDFWKQVDAAAAVARKLGANPNMSQSERKRIGDRIMADPKTPGDLAVSIALDKIIGHLSPRNVERLHNAKIQVKTGGVPTRKQAGISGRRVAHVSPGKAVPIIGGAVR